MNIIRVNKEGTIYEVEVNIFSKNKIEKSRKEIINDIINNNTAYYVNGTKVTVSIKTESNLTVEDNLTNLPILLSKMDELLLKIKK